MRCAFVIQHINALGGTERSACAVMNGLARRGEAVHLIELVGRGDSTYPLESSVVVTSLFERPVKIFNAWFSIVRRLARYLRNNAIETLVIVEATHALYGVAAARLAGVRCVVWEHFNYTVTLNRRKRVWGRKIAARWADDVVVLTGADAALWQRHTAPTACVTVIPNMAPPVQPGRYDAQSRMILTAGRLTEQKGYDLLLQAWAQLVERDEAAEWSLLIRGDGPDKAALMEQMEGLPRVVLAPATEGIAQDYARAALYVCSSRYEGLPMVLLEAAAAGVPIVSFDCVTGPAEIVEQDVSGLLVPPEDVPALVESLAALMRDGERRSEMAVAVKQRALAFQEGPIMARWGVLLGAEWGRERS
nr:glycosyltransferase family 4 protein [uncultured Neokomagataea sp.]